MGYTSMTIEEGLTKTGFPFWISGAKRSDLPAYFVRRGFKKGAEIGVSWGQNIVDYCEAGLEIYGIDPWDPHTDEDEFRTIISIDGRYGRSQDGVYTLAKERTDAYSNCHLMKMTSMEALKYFDDRSLDFVYIDGNHSFGYVAMDLMKWCRKVKKGGVIAGHDYFSHNSKTQRKYRGIGSIVRAFAETYDYTSFYVLGSEKRKEGEDSEVSFLFIKHW